MKGCMVDMYALISNYEYADQFCFIANDPAELEEMALSFFEEDWYEWFCCVNREYENYEVNCTNEAIKREAFTYALDHSFDDYYIIEATFLG